MSLLGRIATASRGLAFYAPTLLQLSLLVAVGYIVFDAYQQRKATTSSISDAKDVFVGIEDHIKLLTEQLSETTGGALKGFETTLQDARLEIQAQTDQTEKAIENVQQRLTQADVSRRSFVPRQVFVLATHTQNLDLGRFHNAFSRVIHLHPLKELPHSDLGIYYAETDDINPILDFGQPLRKTLSLAKPLSGATERLDLIADKVRALVHDVRRTECVLIVSTRCAPPNVNWPEFASVSAILVPVPGSEPPYEQAEAWLQFCRTNSGSVTILRDQEGHSSEELREHLHRLTYPVFRLGGE